MFGIDFSTTTGNVKKNPCTMKEHTIITIAIVSTLLFVLFFSLWIKDQFTKRNLRQRNAVLQNLSMLYENGKRVSLTYRIIEEKHRLYFKNLHNKAEITLFEQTVIPMVLEDFSKIASYVEFRQYVHLNQQETYPFLERLNALVRKEYGGVIEAFFLTEEMAVTSLELVYRLPGVKRFVEELSSPYFRDCKYVCEIKYRMELLQVHLLAVDPSTLPLRSSDIFHKVKEEEALQFIAAEQKN